MPPLRQLLARLWHRRSKLRAALGRLTPTREGEPGDGRAKARARFWDGVREGRREAEAQCAKREP